MNESATITTEEAEVLGSQLWDARKLGGILQGARYGADIRRREDLVVVIARTTGQSVSETTISELENGRRLPSLNALTAIMLTLGISFQDLASAVTEEHREAYRRLNR